MVLSKTMLEYVDLSPMVVDANSAALLLPSHRWLLEQLPSLPLFELVKMNVCIALRHVSVKYKVMFPSCWFLHSEFLSFSCPARASIS